MSRFSIGHNTHSHQNPPLFQNPHVSTTPPQHKIINMTPSSSASVIRDGVTYKVNPILEHCNNYDPFVFLFSGVRLERLSSTQPHK
jgi:hypothetical protein